MVQAADDLRLICPYIRAEQVEDLLGHQKLRSLRVITLCDFRSFLMGASDPEALRRILQLGGEVRTMNSGLHAKIYIADQSAALVTSANFSAGGLTNNFECGVLLQDREAVTMLMERFSLEWRRATPLTEEHIGDLCAELDRERTRAHELLEYLQELKQKNSRRVSGSRSVWTPQTDNIVIELTPDQVAFLQQPLRGQGGYQSLLKRLQNNICGNLLKLTRSDCEKVVRYATKYGEGGFQTRLRSIVQLAELFITD